MTIRPHNGRNPVPLDEPCYRCEGRWKILLLDADDKQRLDWRLVAKCQRCGIVSFATRQAAVTLSLAEVE